MRKLRCTCFRRSICCGVACWAAARWHGEDNRTALAIGSLMNARGLMELIIINIGLSKGIIQPALFSMLVLMAIVTTLTAKEWIAIGVALAVLVVVYALLHARRRALA